MEVPDIKPLRFEAPPRDEPSKDGPVGSQEEAKVAEQELEEDSEEEHELPLLSEDGSETGQQSFSEIGNAAETVVGGADSIRCPAPDIADPAAGCPSQNSAAISAQVVQSLTLAGLGLGRSADTDLPSPTLAPGALDIVKEEVACTVNLNPPQQTCGSLPEDDGADVSKVGLPPHRLVMLPSPLTPEGSERARPRPQAEPPSSVKWIKSVRAAFLTLGDPMHAPDGHQAIYHDRRHGHAAQLISVHQESSSSGLPLPLPWDEAGSLSEEYVRRAGRLASTHRAYEDQPAERAERILRVDADAERLHAARANRGGRDFQSLLDAVDRSVRPRSRC